LPKKKKKTILHVLLISYEGRKRYERFQIRRHTYIHILIQKHVKLFYRIPTFNVYNFTTEIKKSNTFVGFCYVKMEQKKKKNKKQQLGKQPNEKSC